MNIFELFMPLITVSMYPGRTQEQKDEYAKAIRRFLSPAESRTLTEDIKKMKSETPLSDDMSIQFIMTKYVENRRSLRSFFETNFSKRKLATAKDAKILYMLKIYIQIYLSIFCAIMYVQ